MKYKEGDKVRVKSIDWYNANNNAAGRFKAGAYVFTSRMSPFCGTELTIKKVYNTYYKVYENEAGWTDDMLEDARNINVYIYGDAERGDDVIKMLVDCGGKNEDSVLGNDIETLYCISPLYNTIVAIHDDFCAEIAKHGRTELKLPEKPKHKDGDIVVFGNGNIGAIGSHYFLINLKTKEYMNHALSAYCYIERLATPEEADIYHKIVELNITNIDEPNQYDRVLVRVANDCQWQLRCLESMENGILTTCGSYWKYGIKFDGNEHLFIKGS